MYFKIFACCSINLSFFVQFYGLLDEDEKMNSKNDMKNTSHNHHKLNNERMQILFFQNIDYKQNKNHLFVLVWIFQHELLQEVHSMPKKVRLFEGRKKEQEDILDRQYRSHIHSTRLRDLHKKQQ